MQKSPVPLDQDITDAVIRVTNAIESKVDEELDGLDNIEMVRARRLEQIKKEAKKQKEYLQRGHGDYREIDERDVFRVLRSSQRVLLHFYHESDNCKILDAHLTQLCRRHLECRFLRIDAAKSPYFVARLRICVLPTCLLIVNGSVIDRLVGFTELNNTSLFTTRCLEQTLIRKQLFDPTEDEEVPPPRTKKLAKYFGSCIRCSDE